MYTIGDDPHDCREPLWRYLKVKRFVEMMRTGCLYFASARQFPDPFEGAVAVLPPGLSTDSRHSDPSRVGQAFEQLRRLTKICCWHRAQYESDAMWKLYAGSSKGVAIRTTLSRIKTAVKPFRLRPEYGHEDLWAGSVRYIDLSREHLGVDMLERFWHKHMAFSWEQEFRLAISLRAAEEYGVQVPELGILVEFALPELIETIILGPLLSPEDAAEARTAAEEHGLGDRVAVSSLLGTPRYA